MFLTDKTNTTLFLYPVLGLQEHEEAKMGFIGSFLADNDKAYIEDGTMRMFCLFKPLTSNLGFFNQKIYELESIGLIEDEYDYPEGHIVIVFKLPKKFKNDYDLFLKGKYSKFSEEFKALFPDKKISFKNNVKYEDYSLHFHVFRRTPGIKKFIEEKLGANLDIYDGDEDFEYWGIPDIETETLNIENYLKNKNEDKLVS